MKAAAVCIGNNHFVHAPQNNLKGCQADAMAMAALLQDLGVPRVVLRLDSSREDTWGQIKELRDRARTDKLTYAGFSFSSHGTTYPCQEEADGLGEALVCADVREKNGEWDPATIIADKELHTLLWTFPPACRVEIWMDTCFSGGMDRMASPSHQGRFLAAPEKALEPVFPNSRITVGLPPNVVMWTASSEQETSADAYIKSGWHGAFTYFWCRAFQAAPEARRVDLLLAARAGLRDAHYDQLPRLKSWNKPAQTQVGK